ncbi:Uncharacterized protein FVE85_2729 [Porphyridium purpureum]|uniref:Elp3/MiaA/NifB-like radical SAM core domain-containing protein n=1 Tax=Porphyridium purpureum TaxID=35688 RepID=A0A5J4YTI2_PORPP|nr:Uncharacterized protein FVE85_2729 [Porphyridium purpureum]|eukprot:POR1846..scf227_4
MAFLVAVPHARVPGANAPLPQCAQNRPAHSRPVVPMAERRRSRHSPCVAMSSVGLEHSVVNTGMPLHERMANMPRFAAAERRVDPFAGSQRADMREGDSDAEAVNMLNVVYAYPSTYAVGICSLGYQLVHEALRKMRHVSTARLFTDACERLPAQIDVLGISLSWELDYVNIMQHFTLLGIPMMSIERNAPREDASAPYPLVFGGGPVLSANPEPFAEFFDVVLLGDGEELLPEFIEALQRLRSSTKSRRELLIELAKGVPGVYVPQLFEIEYESSVGPIAAIRLAEDARQAGVPETVQKRTFRGRQLATSTIVTEYSAWENIFMVEAVRSCPEMCRFCLASYVTLPFRATDVDNFLIPSIESAMRVTDRIGILGASVTQHPQWDAVVDALLEPRFDGLRISLSSVRTNTVTQRLAEMLVKHGSKSITIAVESGSKRVREIVNKKLAQEDIEKAVLSACRGGLSSLKLYGMTGIPGESDEDVRLTIEMFARLKELVKKEKSSLKLTFGCSTFVPKAHTPFQWFGVRPEAQKRLKTIEKNLKKIGVDFRPESYKWSVIQALLARGDRRIMKVLIMAVAYGDSFGAFNRVFKALKGQVPPLEMYAFEDYPLDRQLPWSHLRTAIAPELIEDHFRSSEQVMSVEV